MCKRSLLVCCGIISTRIFRLLLLCHSWGCQILGQLPFSAIDLVLNSWPQWKKYLTIMQIAQFVIDLVLAYFGSKFYLYSRLFMFLNDSLSLRTYSFQIFSSSSSYRKLRRVRIGASCVIRMRYLNELPRPLYQLLLPNVQETHDDKEIYVKWCH